MKIKTIKTILAAALLTLSGSAMAVSTDGISISNVTVAPGQTQTVSVDYSLNDFEYYEFEMNLVFPEGCPVSLVKKSDDVWTDLSQFECNPSEALSAFTINSYYTNTSGYFLQGLSIQSVALPKGEGELMTFNVTASEEATENSYTIEVKNVVLYYLNEMDEFVPRRFDDFTFTITVSDRVILDENSTKAPQASDGAVDVKVLRTINSGEWSTICLPFTMNLEKFTEAFKGNTVVLAEFKGFETTYADGDDVSPDAITLQFETYTMTPRKPLKGGTPYLIKVETPIESFTADAVTVTPTVNPVTKQDADGSDGSFVGTFAKTKVPADGLFISGNKFWYSTGNTNIKAFRGWFELVPVLGKDLSYANIGFMVDSDPVSVDGIPARYGKAKGDVYTVQGQYLGRNIDLKSLPMGIYIVDGKKKIIK